MGKVSSRLVIFEGPDGAGKTTAALAFAEATGARYVHFGPVPRLGRGLARIYVEAMLPALLGHQNVVFDRSWLSELPYGQAFRHGKDRLTAASRRMLERLAMRCGAVVVRCQPPWEVVRQNYLARRALEMLDNEEQLRQVYDLYAQQGSALPTIQYDYRLDPPINPMIPWALIDRHAMPAHRLNVASAGNWMAPVVLVGERFAELTDDDPFYQWPFASFSGTGCSQWLADQLDTISLSEAELLWVNADQELDWLHDRDSLIVALGDKAAEALYRHKLKAAHAPHPQSWKRFNHGRRYPLLDLLQELTHD